MRIWENWHWSGYFAVGECVPDDIWILMPEPKTPDPRLPRRHRLLPLLLNGLAVPASVEYSMQCAPAKISHESWVPPAAS